MALETGDRLAPTWREFADHLAQLRTQASDVKVFSEQARRALAPLLRPELVPPDLTNQRRPPGTPYLLHRSPAATIFAMASPPGFVSTVHDHGSWGLVGQVSGEEFETGYRFATGKQGLVRLKLAGAQRHLRPGDIVEILPPDHDVHQVTTVGAINSVTIHVFARDVVGEGFSIFEPCLYEAISFVGGYSNDGEHL